MEYITEAVRLARKQAVKSDVDAATRDQGAARRPDAANSQTATAPETKPKDVRIETVSVDMEFLSSQRIVTLDSGDPNTRIFDMLRNHLVNENKDATRAFTIAVTAPTRRCGASFAAANLAFSFARSAREKIILMDVGPKSDSDLVSVLGIPKEAASIAAADPLSLVELRSGDMSLYYNYAATKKSSSQGATVLEGQIRSIVDAASPSVVVVDLPPLLSDDGNVKFALTADVILLVLAVGQSSAADLQACQTFLGPRKGVQLFLNRNRWHGL